MHKTSRLLLMSIFAVVLMAPPASSQKLNTNDRLDIIERDVIELKSALKLMQDASDTRNAEMKTLLDQILGKFATIDSSVQKLNSSLLDIKTIGEKSSRDLDDAKTSLRQMKEAVDGVNKLNLGETLQNMSTQLGNLNRQVTALTNVEKPLPGAKEAFASASSYYSLGIWDLAIPELQDFVKGYSKDSMAPYAQFMLGAALLAKNQPDKAIIELDSAIQNYPDSDKKCSALFKKGLAHTQLKEIAQAKETYIRVQKECPGSEESAQATDSLKKLLATPARGRGAPQ